MPRAPKAPGHAEPRPPWQGSTRGPATAHRRWRDLRDIILDRDHHVCYLCCQPGADTVDHIVPVSHGGADDPGNLAAVHDRTPPHCHRTKTTHDRAPRQ